MESPRNRAARSRSQFTFIAAAAATSALVQCTASLRASPVFNAKLVARDVTAGDLNFSSTVSVSLSDTIEYRLIGNTSPLGTVYGPSTGFTITALNPGIDGANSLRFDLFQTTSEQIQANFSATGTLQNGWDAPRPDVSTGQLSLRGNGYNDITGVRPIRASGDFSALAEEIILSGTFSIASMGTGSNSLLALRWSNGSGAIHFNGSGLSKFPSLSTETGSQPFLSYLPLTLKLSPPPPPPGTPPGGSWNVNASGTWSVASNWLNSVIPNGVDHVVTFGNVITASRVVTMDSDILAGEIYFNSPYQYSIYSGAFLHLFSSNGTALIHNGPLCTGLQGVGTSINLQSNLQIDAGSGTIAFQNIHGSGAAVDIKGGRVLFPLANFFDGGLTVRNGATLQFSRDTALGAAAITTITLDNGTLQYYGGVNGLQSPRNIMIEDGSTGTLDTTYEAIQFNAVLGNGTLIKNGSNPLLLPSIASPVTIINAGTLQLSVDNAFTSSSPSLTLNNSAKLEMAFHSQLFGTLSSTSTQSAVNLSNRTLTLGVGGASASFRGTIQNESTATTSAFVTKTGAGTQAVGRIVKAGVNVNQGVLQLAPGGASVASYITSLSIAPAARFDLTDGRLIVDDSEIPITDIKQYVKKGRGGTGFGNATWNGAGAITSSAAAPGGIGDGTSPGDGVSFAIGYLSNSVLPSLGLPSYTTFGGQAVNIGSILVRFTKGADANLDGKVNSDDVTIVGALYNNASSGQWYLGDFDYDGICDSDDITVLGALYDATAPALSTPHLTAQYGSDFAAAFARGQALGAAVPEPTCLSIFGTGGLALMRRRRKRKI